MAVNDQERMAVGEKVTKVIIGANLGLAALKLLAGFFGRSNAMIADGVNSTADVLTTAAVMMGLRLSNKPEDESHPYGHEKIEPVVAKLLAIVLFGTALLIGYNAVQLIRRGGYETPRGIAIYAAVVSLGIKEWMYRYTVKGARKINSAALMADAWNHRTDSFSSVGTLVGIVGARMGFPILDPLAAILVAILIMKVALDIYMESIHQLMDRAADKITVEKIEKLILEVQGVCCIDLLKTRIHVSKLYVDVEIGVDENLTVKAAHEIAEAVHDHIEAKEERVKHCMVHVNPHKLVSSK